MSEQYFRVIRAPEEPPLATKCLEHLLYKQRTGSEWHVVDVTHETLTFRSELALAQARLKLADATSDAVALLNQCRIDVNSTATMIAFMRLMEADNAYRAAQPTEQDDE